MVYLVSWLALWAHAADPVVDVCFNGATFPLLQVALGGLLGTITTLFGWLMLSYRGQLQQATLREQRAQENWEQTVKSAINQRNEAVWRLNETREEYREFAESVAPPHLRRQFPSPPGSRS